LQLFLILTNFHANKKNCDYVGICIITIWLTYEELRIKFKKFKFKKNLNFENDVI